MARTPLFDTTQRTHGGSRPCPLRYYHAFGLKGIRDTSPHYKADAVILRPEMTDALIQCPKCGCRKATMKGQETQRFFMSPHRTQEMHPDPSFSAIAVYSDCATLWWPRLPFMMGKQRCVRSFALTVLDLLRFGSIRWVAH